MPGKAPRSAAQARGKVCIKISASVRQSRAPYPPDPATVDMAPALLERSAGRRFRRCANLIARNAGKRGEAWSLCLAGMPAVAAEARQLSIEPPLIRRCLVCRVLIGERDPRARTCGSACRNLLSRVLRAVAQ